jgi:hypothetical protein
VYDDKGVQHDTTERDDQDTRGSGTCIGYPRDIGVIPQTVARASDDVTEKNLSWSRSRL